MHKSDEVVYVFLLCLTFLTEIFKFFLHFFKLLNYFLANMMK